MSMFSYEEEQQLLATLINHPDSFIEISSYINEEDFYRESSDINRSLFSIIKRCIESGEQIDYVMLIERAKSFNLSNQDGINIADYIQALSLRKTNPENIINLGKDLKYFSVRRKMFDCGKSICKKAQSISPDIPFQDFIESTDQIYNGTTSLYDNGANVPEDLFAGMEDLIEDRGNNPIEEFGLLGPHRRLHELYGSLLRPGNITTVAGHAPCGESGP